MSGRSIPAKQNLDSNMDPRIHEFLDQRMSPDERAAFLEQVSQDDALHQELDAQQEINAALARCFGHPRLDKALAAITAAGSPTQTPPDKPPIRLTRGARLLAAAALLAMSAGGLWYSYALLRPRPAVDPYALQPWRSFETVYNDTVREGFKPAWVCRNEREFERTFARRIKQPLLLAKLPAGVTAGGLGYSNTITPLTINVLGRVDGTPVMVFVDKLAADIGPPPPPPKGLNIFRHQIADLVLYEVSPLDQPHILQHFYVP